jgi:hypothetical protein
MQTIQTIRWIRWITFAVLTVAVIGVSFEDARGEPPGMNPHAKNDLRDAGVNQWVGQFKPTDVEEIGDWTKYTFDTEGGEGPICITGTEFTAFHQRRDPKKLIIHLDGGGACWEGFPACSLFADEDGPSGGIFADSGLGIDNPFADWSKVYLSYCDGSVWTGNNVVEDPNFPGGVRIHRGVRNLTAGLDLARDLHPAAKVVLLSGLSAGGYGVSAGFAPWVYRFVFPPSAELYVLNDAGPALTNFEAPFDVLARANDWGFEQFYPASCTECDPFNQPAEAVKWTLENDNGYEGALVTADGDTTIGVFYLKLPSPAAYRDLLLEVHDPINAAYPDRYKRFIVGGATYHTAIGNDRFYSVTENGLPLYQWIADFVNDDPNWVDNVGAP